MRHELHSFIRIQLLIIIGLLLVAGGVVGTLINAQWIIVFFVGLAMSVVGYRSLKGLPIKRSIRNIATTPSNKQVIERILKGDVVGLVGGICLGLSGAIAITMGCIIATTNSVWLYLCLAGIIYMLTAIYAMWNGVRKLMRNIK